MPPPGVPTIWRSVRSLFAGSFIIARKAACGSSFVAGSSFEAAASPAFVLADAVVFEGVVVFEVVVFDLVFDAGVCVLGA